MKIKEDRLYEMPRYQQASTKKEQFQLWKEEKKNSIQYAWKGEKLGHSIKDHLATSAGVITGSLPVYALLEMGVSGLSPLESLYTRLSSAEAGLLGLNILYIWGREAAHIHFGITEKSTGFEKKAADFTYQGLFSLVTFPILTTAGRLVSNLPLDAIDIGRETLTVSLMGLVAGPFVGLGVDTYRELCSTHFSSRIPEKIRKWPQRAKIGLALLATATSLYVSRGLYETFSDPPFPTTSQPYLCPSR